MAHIFIGNRSYVDAEVLEGVKHLPDDFWIFVEFTVNGRNIDLFVVREAPVGSRLVQHSTIIVTEVKRVSRPLEGSVDSPWRQRTLDGAWEDIEPSNQDDLNYYWQAVNAANALSQWLWNNQSRYLEYDEPLPPGEFKIWPDILLLSPPGTMHRLPMQPPSRYGQWWYGIEDWLRHIESWNPRVGVRLNRDQLGQLAEALRLQELPQERPEPAASGAPASQGGGPEGFLTWLKELEARVKDLEARLRRLEG